MCHAVHDGNTPYTFIVALIQHNALLSPNMLYTAIYHLNDYLVGVLAPPMICNHLLSNFDTIEVPTLQQWIAHWLRRHFTYQQIIRLPLSDRVKRDVLGIHFRD